MIKEVQGREVQINVSCEFSGELMETAHGDGPLTLQVREMFWYIAIFVGANKKGGSIE